MKLFNTNLFKVIVLVFILFSFQTITNAQNQDKKIIEAEIGETLTTEGGEFTLLNKNEDLDIIIDHGPFEIKVIYLTAVEVTTGPALKSYYDNKDKVNLITIGFEIENKSDDVYSIYPDQSTIVVNKQQIEADIMMSDSVGGDYLGNVVKSGAVHYVYEGDLEDVNDVKLYLSSAIDSEYNRVDDDIIIDLSFSDTTEEKKEDQSDSTSATVTLKPFAIFKPDSSKLKFLAKVDTQLAAQNKVEESNPTDTTDSTDADIEEELEYWISMAHLHGFQAYNGFGDPKQFIESAKQLTYNAETYGYAYYDYANDTYNQEDSYPDEYYQGYYEDEEGTLYENPMYEERYGPEDSTDSYE